MQATRGVSTEKLEEYRDIFSFFDRYVLYKQQLNTKSSNLDVWISIPNDLLLSIKKLVTFLHAKFLCFLIESIVLSWRSEIFRRLSLI